MLFMHCNPVKASSVFLSCLTLFSVCLFKPYIVDAEKADHGTAPDVYRKYIDAVNMQADPEGFSEKALPRNAGWYMSGSFKDADSLKKAFLSYQLERILEPGVYAVWIKINKIGAPVLPDPLDSGSKSDFEDDAPGSDPANAVLNVSLGNTTKRMIFPREKGSFAGAVLVDAEKAFHNLRITVAKPEQEIGIEKVYVSGQPHDITVSADGATINTRLIFDSIHGIPPPAERSPEKNHIVNGSFETGHAGYYWCFPYQSSFTVNPESLDSGMAAVGSHSLRVELRGHRYVDAVKPSAGLLHRPINLKPDTEYFFRGMFRSEFPAIANCIITPAYDDDTKKAIANARTGFSTNWTPLEFSFKTTSDQRGYYLRLNFRSTLPGNKPDQQQSVWMDSLVLSEDKPEGFVPSASVEYGVSWSVPGKIFYSGAGETFVIQTKNHASSPARVALNCRVFNYYDIETKSEVMETVVEPGKIVTAGFDPFTGKTGAFRLVVDGVAYTDGTETILPTQEYVFSILPPAPQSMNGTLGAYINMQAEPLEIMSRAGVRRTTTLSSGNERLSVWKIMEPEKGVFRWWDEHVALAKKYGVDITVNFEFQDPPDYALNPSDPADEIKFSGARKKGGGFSAKAMSDFVEAVVAHYKNDIKSWLMVDEPYHYFSMEEYCKIVKTASEAARRADPECKVLMHGAYYPQNLPKLDELGIAEYVDGVSGYARTPEQGKKLKDFREKHELPILYTVEYSWQVSMYQSIHAPNSWQQEPRNSVAYRQNGATLTTLPVKYMAWAGADGFTRYDARYPGGDFTQLDNYKSMFEYDGALKPSAVAYAIMAQMLDGFTGVKELELRSDLKTFLFENDKRAAIIFMTENTDIENVYVAEIAPPPDMRMFDMMGNPLLSGTNTVFIGADINYLFFDKLDMSAAETFLKSIEMKEPLEISVRTAKDGNTGQYILSLEVKNTMDSETISVDAYFGGSVREFWNRGRSWQGLAPGLSVETSVGLNVYDDEDPKPTPGTVHLLIKMRDSSALIVKRMENIFNPNFVSVAP